MNGPLYFEEGGGLGNRPFARSGHMVQKITYAGEQVAQWLRSGTSKTKAGPGGLRNLLTSMCDFSLYHVIVQRAYFPTFRASMKIG